MRVALCETSKIEAGRGAGPALDGFSPRLPEPRDDLGASGCDVLEPQLVKAMGYILLADPLGLCVDVEVLDALTNLEELGRPLHGAPLTYERRQALPELIQLHLARVVGVADRSLARPLDERVERRAFAIPALAQLAQAIRIKLASELRVAKSALLSPGELALGHVAHLRLERRVRAVYIGRGECLE